MRSTEFKSIYDKEYFERQVDGAERFAPFDGSFGSLFERYQRNIDLLDLRAEHKLLDIGCGRGEIVLYHAKTGGAGKGYDYSQAAITMAIEKARSLRLSEALFEVASFTSLWEKEAKSSFDRILASEFIEHISEEEGVEFFRVASSLLKPGGKLLVFTHPNTNQRKYGYPIMRAISLLKAWPLPKQQADTLGEHYRLYHLNEQNSRTIKRLARSGNFADLRVGYDVVARSRVAKIVLASPLKHYLATNMYLIATK